MGVMECSKQGCPNILCTESVEDIGYLCDEHFKKYLDVQMLTSEDVNVLRLIYSEMETYHEEDYDYMIKFKKIIEKLDKIDLV